MRKTEKNEILAQAELQEKKNNRKRIWRSIVGVLACVVVFCTTYALILPAITMEKYICGMDEHTHTDSCYTLVEGSSVDALSCITPESETHTHSTRCYGAWTLTCTLPEHTHVESCKPGGLDDAQRAQVDAVIAKIDALPTTDEIDTQLAAYADDPDGEEAYLTQVFTEVQATYKLYVALGADLQSYVTNSDKLMELEWIWAATTFAEENTGKTILEWPSSNHVYVNSLTLNKRVTGEGYFDTEATEDAEGLDRSPDDNILRTFDMATYTIEFTTALRNQEEMLQAYRDEGNRQNDYRGASNQIDVEATANSEWNAVKDVSGYEKCFAYFEFAVPGTAEEVYFETTAMPWLQLDGNFSVVRQANLDLDHDGTAELCQVLQGRVLLQADDQSVVGASAHQLYFCFRALNLKAEDTLQPYFCISLMYNNAMERVADNANHYGTIIAQAFYDADGNAISATNISTIKVDGKPMYYWKDSSVLYDSSLEAYWDNCKYYRRFVIDDVPVTNGGTVTKENSFINNHSCSYCNLERDWDFCEAKGLTFEPLEISCKPSYNIALVTADKTRTGTFNFRETENKNAINYDLYSDDKAAVNGRLLGYGIRVEIVGEKDKGIRGVEMPDPQEELTLEFDLDFSSQLRYTTDESGTAVTKRVPTAGTSYELLYWSGGANHTDGTYKGKRLPYDDKGGGFGWFNEDQRSTFYAEDVSYRTFINQLPYNREASSGTSAANQVNTCQEGGRWTFTENPDGTIHGTVTGAKLVNNVADYPFELTTEGKFTGESNSNLAFPCVPLSYNAPDINYYNYKDAAGNFMNHYWEMGNPAVINRVNMNVFIEDPRIVFSAGEIWFIQPYYGIPESGVDANVHIAASSLTGHSCDAIVDVATSNFAIYSGTGDTKTLITTEETELPNDKDDKSNKSYTFVNPGSIYSYISYVKGDQISYTETLAGDEREDSDWVVKGQELSIGTHINHQDGEGEYVGVAYDMLVKFDGDFMGLRANSPNVWYKGTEFGTRWGEYTSKTSLKKNVLYACKPDGSNWTSVDEMKQATVDDLVYYDSYDDWLASGNTMVGVLAEFRGRQPGFRLQFFVDGYAKQTAEAGKVYMVTRNCYAWRMRDVAEAAMIWWNNTHPDQQVSNVAAVTTEMCDQFARSDAFPSRANAPKKTLLNKDTIMSLGKTAYHSDYAGMQPFWRQDYYVTLGTGMVDGSSVIRNVYGLRDCAPATYDVTGYVAGSGAYFYQDSCLLLDFVPTITKSVAQRNEIGGAKSVFDMDTAQRYVDYALDPGFTSVPTVSDSTGDMEQTVTLQISDVLPDNLTYVDGSAYWGGTYTQTEGCKKPGTVTGGVPIEPVLTVIEENDPYFPDDAGKVLLTFTITTTVDMSKADGMEVAPIYFSCYIGSSNPNEDVTNGTVIYNKATIRDLGADMVAYDSSKNNLSVTSFTVSKLTTYAISKVAENRVLETDQVAAFTLTVSNPSTDPLRDQIILDELPYDADAEGYNTGYRGSTNGTNVDSGWVELLNVYVGAEGDAATVAPIVDGLTFRYTGYSRASAFGDHTAADWKMSEFDRKTSSGAVIWGSRSFNTTQTPIIKDGITYYPLSGIPSFKSYSRTVPFIAITGDIPANTTIKIYIELAVNTSTEGIQLSASGGDKLVNYMYKYNGGENDVATELVSSDWVQYVSRTMEGVTWVDSDGDAMQDLDEKSLPGMQVELYKLKTGGTASNFKHYEAVTLADGTAVKIPVGQQISLRAGSLAEATTYVKSSGQTWVDARYRFTDIPEGTYAVRFTDGGTDLILPMLASASNHTGVSDTLDSDGVPIYNAAKTELHETRILGIVMPKATSMSYGVYNSLHHDSGFYNRGYVLPDTGGTGTQLYTWGGIVLIAFSMLALLYNPKRRREEQGSP